MPAFSYGGRPAGRSPAELLFVAATTTVVLTTTARQARRQDRRQDALKPATIGKA